MARSKVGPAGYESIAEALVILSVVGFFVVALLTGFGGNALSGLRERIGLRPQAAEGVSIVSPFSVSPTLTPGGATPFQISAVQIDTPIPVLATVDAIMTAHAERMQGSEPPTSTPTVDLQTLASASTAQPTSTAQVTPAPTQTQLSGTPTPVATSTPTIARSTTTSTATSTSTLDDSTATRTATRAPTVLALTATGTATRTPLPAATGTATGAPLPTATGTATGTPLPTATGTAMATATVASTSAPAYAPPILIGASVGSGAIVLSWSESVPLGPNDYFDVRVWQDGQPANGIANVQQPSYVIGGNFPAGNYNWTIAVIRKQGGQIQILSIAPTTLHFTWTPAGSGGGPPTR